MVETAQFIKDYGWLAVTILLIMGGMARFYVFRWQYDERSKEVEFWRERYLKNSERLDQALNTLQEAIGLAKDRKG